MLDRLDPRKRKNWYLPRFTWWLLVVIFGVILYVTLLILRSRGLG